MNVDKDYQAKRATALTLARILSTEALRALAVSQLVRLVDEAANVIELAQAVDECKQMERYAKRYAVEQNRAEASRYENS